MNRHYNALIGICSLLLLGSSCKEQVKQESPIRPVKIEKTLVSHSQSTSLNLPASVNELTETKLSFRVGGPIVQLNDIVGDYVRKGDVIARIDQRDFQIGVEATKAVYELAEAEYERFKNLVEQESASKSTFDQIESKYKLAKTEYNAAKNALNDTEIIAPFSGYINLVMANNYESVAPGQPIVSLLDVSKYEINAWISIQDVAQINEHTQYTCIIKQDGKNIRIDGKLKEIGNKTSMSKQSLPITIVINPSSELKLHAGMSTYLEVNIKKPGESNAVHIPVTSVFTKDNKKLVWIYNEESNTVTEQAVATGKVFDNGNIEILKGLSGNEYIVTAGVSYLFDGQKVKKFEGYSETNVGNKL